MTKRMLIMLGGVVLLTAGLAFGFFLHIKQIIANSPKPTPVTVTTAIASMQEWQAQLAAVGTLRAVHGVDISSEVPGQVRRVAFRSGQSANAGDVLLQLNADTDIAQLASLKASAELAEVTLKRDQAQLIAQGVSQAQVDNDLADLKIKKALVAQQEAFVQKKTIRAPFGGRLGIVTANPGQYLNPGDKIVTLQEVDPIYVDFYLPQRNAGSLFTGQKVLVKSDAYPEAVFQGRITAISPKVDAATRNLQVEATVANPKRQLLPGMFATAMVDIGGAKRFLTLPQTAITYNPYGSTVFVVKPAKGIAGPGQGAVDLEVQQAFVTAGDTRGDQVAVTSGLTEGQTVVTSGQVKLKNGTRIVVDNMVKPANDPNPSPQEH